VDVTGAIAEAIAIPTWAAGLLEGMTSAVIAVAVIVLALVLAFWRTAP
jgi:hypothetical protein